MIARLFAVLSGRETDRESAGRHPRRWLVLVTLIAFTWYNLACTSTRTEPPQSAFAAQHAQEKGVRIAGYVTTDGVYHEFEGRVRQTGNGVLSFTPERTPPNEHAQRQGLPQPFTLPEDEVASLRVVRTEGGKTAGMVVLAIVGAVVVLAAIVALTKESCPFVYAFDGERYVFDGEPYGGAITAGLARTDASELEHLREVDGQYRLLLTNEVDETQHTDSLALLVVDHPEGTAAVVDQEGSPHSFRTIVPLRSATVSDDDVTRWLVADDDVAWEHDLRRVSAPLADSRDRLELVFPRPPRDRVWLLVRAASTAWASHMLRSSLDLRGSTVDDYYAALDNDPAARARWDLWQQREEVMTLGVEVEESDGWRRQAWLQGEGPFISERRAIPLDLSQVVGERVRLRLRPPVGFWSFDSVALAWDEEEVRTTQVSASSAVDGHGVDVRALLSSDDGGTLDFPVAGDYALLVFPAPPASEGCSRTVFAVTHGWYDIHLYGRDRAPDEAQLTALRDEPGFIVNRAVSEFAAVRATHLVPGTRAASDE